MKIITVKRTDKTLLDSINALLPQLTSTCNPLVASHLEQIMASTCSQLFVAMEDSTMVGMVTLVMIPIPTGCRAWIEDLVVDEGSRGKGIARQLMQKALVRAQSQGADNINLTAHPSRRSARALYRKMGFTTREADIYRLLP